MIVEVFYRLWHGQRNVWIPRYRVDTHFDAVAWAERFYGCRRTWRVVSDV
jgi:hypothetical protein